jgi:hypothetical protein
VFYRFNRLSLGTLWTKDARFLMALLKVASQKQFPQPLTSNLSYFKYSDPDSYIESCLFPVDTCHQARNAVRD